MQNLVWYFLDPSGLPNGPHTAQGLHEFVEKGVLNEEVLVWKEGLEDWQKYNEIKIEEDFDYRKDIRRIKEAKQAVSKEDPEIKDPELLRFEAEIQALEAEEEEGQQDEMLDQTVNQQQSPQQDEPQPELEFEDDDGTLYVWDKILKKYIQEDMDASAVNKEGMGNLCPDKKPTELPSYQVEEMTYEPEDEIIPDLATVKATIEEQKQLQEESYVKYLNQQEKGQLKINKKRKFESEQEYSIENQEVAQNGQKEKSETQQSQTQDVEMEEHQKENDNQVQDLNEKQSQKQNKPKKTTSVYVTGFPGDVTLQEVFAAFSKCGIIKEDENGQPRIKIYRHKESGLVKGDGLVTYLKAPSVELACQILDGTYFREGMGKCMTVEPAQFTQLPNRKKKPGNTAGGAGKNNKGKEVGDKGKGTVISKGKRIKGKRNQEHLLSWTGTDDRTKPTEVTVILEHMFHPDELITNPQEVEDLESDVRQECESIGKVIKLKIYKHNKDGVVMVRFALPSQAQECIKLLNKRWFGGRQVFAHLWDGFTNYNIKPEESAEEQERRLEQFAKELEGQKQQELQNDVLKQQEQNIDERNDNLQLDQNQQVTGKVEET
eukprot:TRINITY_DN8001_c0_g1_i5.p1 TRINITY_DN8001_c0_g1~~TRINITY_DN8001_c0_g1_i5.p1  ORF type:complete len:636 (+),score=106.64 TRINITY_DN8001_c0_g1_i5:102-1910(+)